MKKLILKIGVFNFFSLLAIYAVGQKIENLKTGDLLPDIKIVNLFNSPKSKVSTSEYKNKLLIIDFWATWCNPCVRALPKLDSLQNEFGNSIQILCVSNEDKSTVASFLSNINRVYKVNLPIVFGDTVINKMFPHIIVPQYVWVKSGNVVAITGPEEMNRENIASLLKGKTVAMSQKKDEKINIGKITGAIFSPVLKTSNNESVQYGDIPESSLIMHSAFTRYTEGLYQGGGIPNDSLVTVCNTTIFQLYRMALWKFGMQLFNQLNTVVDINDPILYEKITNSRFDKSPLKRTREETEQWNRLNRFCYELQVPSLLSDQIFNIMLEDLNRYFGRLYGIEGVIEKRNTRFLALSRMSAENRFATKGGSQIIDKSTYHLKTENVNFNILIGCLSQFLQFSPPIVDETSYQGNLDIELNCTLTNLNSVNQELAKYDLRLVEKEKMMDVAVIRMKK
jgi:thiol-disulfide isomerase/thioredoxin